MTKEHGTKAENQLNADFKHAKQCFGSGKVDEAELILQNILARDSNHFDATEGLAVLYATKGDLKAAIPMFQKAAALRPSKAGVHFNLGTALTEAGRLEEAVAALRQCLRIDPNAEPPHIHLGNAYKEIGDLNAAVTSFRRAVEINPASPIAHNNIGNALRDLGKLENAVESYRKALTFRPDYAEAHSNLGNALRDLGKLENAVESYRKALTFMPDYAEAHSNLGNALHDLGKLDQAFKCHRHAVSLDPKNDLFWIGLAASVEFLSFTSADDNLWQDLLYLIERPTVRPSQVVRPVISALRHHPDFSQVLELTGSGKTENGITYGDAAGRLSSIPLLLRIMRLSPIFDLEIERMLTFLRHAMVKETAAGMTKENGLPFSAALALHCHTNEYVFPETDEEKNIIEHLQHQIAALVGKDCDVPPSFVAAFGAYRPLDGYSWAETLLDREWPDDIKEVIARQISEPLEEQSLRPEIPRVTSIEDTVSQSVRNQYEESPYPRWIKTNLADKGRAIGTVLREALNRFDLGNYDSPENPEILVAGCGTGQHALDTASRFSNANVLAVDLSLSSLSYALRMTNQFGLSNIEYAQADIMELGSLDRRFDLIECGGVLHHLGDPLSGWRILVDLLRPGGLMKIGLYSETARQDIISGRSLIAEKGYTTSAEDIRRCRQDIITMAENGNWKMAKICNYRDFFSLSDCRDLLFHVQEHRFTLPQIEAALRTLKLKFLAFEMRNQETIRTFQASYPKEHALTSLPLWHTFECNNPDTFKGMYQFWCRKM